MPISVGTYLRSRRLTRRLGLLALVGVIPILGSCATLKQLSFERPSLQLDAIEITGLNLEGVSLVLWLDVYNPNGYEIRTTRVDAELQLEDTRFGSALLEENVPLAPAAHTLVKIPAAFTWQGIGAGARALLESGKVDYELDTRLRVETSLGSRTLNIGHRGQVPIRDLVP